MFQNEPLHPQNSTNQAWPAKLDTDFRTYKNWCELGVLQVWFGDLKVGIVLKVRVCRSCKVV